MSATPPGLLGTRSPDSCRRRGAPACVSVARWRRSRPGPGRRSIPAGRSPVRCRRSSAGPSGTGRLLDGPVRPRPHRGRRTASTGRHDPVSGARIAAAGGLPGSPEGQEAPAVGERLSRHVRGAAKCLGGDPAVHRSHSGGMVPPALLCVVGGGFAAAGGSGVGRNLASGGGPAQRAAGGRTVRSALREMVGAMGLPRPPTPVASARCGNRQMSARRSDGPRDGHGSAGTHGPLRCGRKVSERVDRRARRPRRPSCPW